MYQIQESNLKTKLHQPCRTNIRNNIPKITQKRTAAILNCRKKLQKRTPATQKRNHQHEPKKRLEDKR